MSFDFNQFAPIFDPIERGNQSKWREKVTLKMHQQNLLFSSSNCPNTSILMNVITLKGCCFKWWIINNSLINIFGNKWINNNKCNIIRSVILDQKKREKNYLIFRESSPLQTFNHRSPKISCITAFGFRMFFNQIELCFGSIPGFKCDCPPSLLV